MKEDRPGSGTKFWLDRSIFTSDVWFASPWKLKVWIYLIGNANHKDSTYMGVPVKRGQILRSLRTVAKDCAYMIGYRLKKPTVESIRRIYEDLTKEGRIVQRTVQQGTLVTILNYDSFQSCSKHEVDSEVDYEIDNNETMERQYNNVNNANNEKPNTSFAQTRRKPSSSKPKSEIVFDYTACKFQGISQKHLDRWATAYPACNISIEIARAAEWCVSNPKKTKKNWLRFLTNWLSHQQERGGTKGGNSSGKELSWAEKRELKRKMEEENDGQSIPGIH